MEPVEAFRARSRQWIHANVPRPGEVVVDRASGGHVRRAQQLQQQIFDAGFAAITWPVEYGGQALTTAHMHAFIDELRGFESPYRSLSVSLGVVGPTILELGTPELWRAYLPSLLRGDTLWVQLLSEPSGGSDMAGVLTRGERDGEVWRLNGSKVWTTFGQYADFGLCLARTNWDVQKHRGLSMFIVPLDAQGVTVRPLRKASGDSEFCEEFLADVMLPADHLLGAENDGWNVASLLLMQERNALGGGSKYFAGSDTEGEGTVPGADVVQLAKRTGVWDDPLVRDVVTDYVVNATVAEQLASRVATGMRTGALPGPAGSLLKLYTADLSLQHDSTRLAIAGADAAAWAVGDEVARDVADEWLVRQGVSIMGGTSEIQRNIISERVLGMPREFAPDKDVPFREVRTNRQGNQS